MRLFEKKRGLFTIVKMVAQYCKYDVQEPAMQRFNEPNFTAGHHSPRYCDAP